MNKTFSIILSVIIVLGLTLGGCGQIVNSKLQFQNFGEVREDYQLIANICLYYYDIYHPSNGAGMTLLPQTGTIDYDEGNECLRISEVHIAAMKTIRDTLGKDCFFWVTRDYVVFWQDKTRQYGLLYSSDPIAAIRDMKANGYEGLDNHRLTNSWNEIGYWEA